MIEELKEQIKYIDTNNLILMFVYVQENTTLFNDIEFFNENDCIYEEDEEGELIYNFVDNQLNQLILINWMIENNEDFISLDNKVRGKYYE